MQPLEINNALHFFEKVSGKQAANILDQQHSSPPANPKTDEENNSNSPMFNNFYNEGCLSAHSKMTNFLFHHIFKPKIDISEDTAEIYNVGHGIKMI